ncbi:MAG TPA: hypothetical protein VKZ53_20950 [Candidatus Angelobacter sp.]|nr:hypothetical protein [Candidatus Angelobacter sp.]
MNTEERRWCRDLIAALNRELEQRSPGCPSIWKSVQEAEVVAATEGFTGAGLKRLVEVAIEYF